MTLRNPFTLIVDETVVPTSTSSGTGLFHPPKMVSHSSKRLRSDASFHAFSGLRSDDTETSTVAMSSPLPGHAAGINECPDFPDPAPKDCETDHERFVATFSAGCRD